MIIMLPEKSPPTPVPMYDNTSNPTLKPEPNMMLDTSHHCMKRLLNII